MSEEPADELQAFVASSLRSIMKGISEAQKDAKVPSAWGTGAFAFNGPKAVEFDIAVSAERSGSSKAGFEVKVWSIGANAGGDLAARSSTVSRIKFTVPTGFKSGGAEKSSSRYGELDD